MGALGKTGTGEDAGEAAGGPQGYGEQNDQGLHRWYDVPQAARRQGPTWPQILEQWQLIEADLHEVYGIDLDDRDLLRARSWRWLKVRIVGLLDDAESRLYRALNPPRR